MKNKQCNKCKEVKNIEDFHKRNDRKSGYQSQCKKCQSKASKLYRIKNYDNILETHRIWKKNNPDYYNKNKDNKFEIECPKCKNKRLVSRSMIWIINNSANVIECKSCAEKDNKKRLGNVLSIETKEKMSLASLGKSKSLQHRVNISKAKEGIMFSQQHIENLIKSHRGIQQGENSGNWRKGISFGPYSIDFNERLKEEIRKRDNYRCQECFRYQDELYTATGKKYKLMVHHIDYNKKNTDKNNLISLCRGCHMQTNYNREDWTNYFRKGKKELI